MRFLRDVIASALQSSQIETRSFGAFDEAVLNVETAVEKAIFDEPRHPSRVARSEGVDQFRRVQRRYSIVEIDAMRRAVSARMLVKFAYPNQSPTLVEERLRTYMLNGTDPDELIMAAESARAELRERHRRRMRMQP